MFDALTGRFDTVFRKLRQRGRLHPKQVEVALDDIRSALLDGDVALDVVDDFLGRVRARALSDEVMRSLTPAQQVVKIVRDELQTTLGGEYTPFTLPGVNPVVIMMAGVQGSGKTTHSREARAAPEGEGPPPAAGRGRPPAAGRRRAAVHPGRRDRGPGGVRRPRPGEGREERREAGEPRGQERGHHRHGRPPARGPRDDEAGQADPRRDAAAPRPDGVRRDDRSGRRRAGTRVHEGRRPDRLHPDEGRRRRPRRRGAVDHVRDRAAHLLRRHRRARAGPRALLSGPDGLAHSRHGRRPDAHREGREGARPGQGARGRGEDGRGAVHAGRLPDADAGGEEARPAPGPAGDDARDARAADRS